MYKAFLIILSLCSSAYALDGQLAGDRFRFVVQLDITHQDGRESGCTGTIVDNGTVVTAAHCILKPRFDDAKCAADFFANRVTATSGSCLIWNNNAKFMKLRYINKYGIARTIAIEGYNWEEQYPWNHLLWQRTNRNPNSTPTEKNDKYVRNSLGDLSFLMTKVLIDDPPVYGHIIWDALGPVIQDMKNTNDWVTTNTRKTAIDRIFETRFGKGPYEAVVVGYGQSGPYDACEKNQSPCRSDHLRRYATIPIIPSTSTIKSVDFTIGNNRNVTIPIRPPWYWTGGPVNGESPMRSGDSGGPMFVKALDGKWYFVAMTAGTNGQVSYHASPLLAPFIWKEALKWATIGQ
jgi:Trypsin